MVATQDIAYRDGVDAVPQVRQGALVAPVTPRPVLFGHADHELFNLLRDTRASQLLTMPTPIKLLRNQVLVPPQKGVGGDNRGNLLQTFAAKRVSQRSKPAAFGIRQAQSVATELGFEDTVFLMQIGDNLLLVPLEPPSDHGDQNVEDHSAPQVGIGVSMVRFSIHPTQVASIG